MMDLILVSFAWQEVLPRLLPENFVAWSTEFARDCLLKLIWRFQGTEVGKEEHVKPIVVQGEIPSALSVNKKLGAQLRHRNARGVGFQARNLMVQVWVRRRYIAGNKRPLHKLLFRRLVPVNIRLRELRSRSRSVYKVVHLTYKFGGMTS